MLKNILLLLLILTLMFVNGNALEYKVKRKDQEKPTYQEYLRKARGFFNDTNSSV